VGQRVLYGTASMDATNVSSHACPRNYRSLGKDVLLKKDSGTVNSEQEVRFMMLYCILSAS
jgi:hypothetical protein